MGDISRGITVLIASCPCAYIMVSSSAMIASIAILTKNGIIVKNSNFIEKLSHIDTVVFDKTGTLTEGGLFIKKCILVTANSNKQLIDTAALVASGSTHPVSKAIAKASNIKLNHDYIISEYLGLGMIGKNSDNVILIGKRDWLIEKGYKVDEIEKHEGPITWVAKNNKVLGSILLSDKLRAEAPEVLQNIRNNGVKKIILLTGDHKKAAIEIVSKLKLDGVFADLMPEDKRKFIIEEKSKSNNVVLVGDGVNDALALVEADVGIAMGAMGSDTAINSSDIALMSNNLNSIPYLFKIAKYTKKIINQNLIIAFLSSVTMIILAMFGVIDPIISAVLHNIGAFLVILNSSKILRNQLSDNDTPS